MRRKFSRRSPARPTRPGRRVWTHAYELAMAEIYVVLGKLLVSQ